MKGEYFIMNNASLRRIFSLLLAVMMVCALLPTAAFAEDIAEPQDGNGGVAAYANSSVPLTLNISSYSAPFYNPAKGTHDVGSFRAYLKTKYSCTISTKSKWKQDGQKQERTQQAYHSV